MTPITIPKLGLTMESATLLRWEVHPGQRVGEGDTVLVLETDKVTYEVRAPVAGILHPTAHEGAVCAVEEVVGYLAEDEREYARLAGEGPRTGTAPGPQRPPQGPCAPPSVPSDTRIKASPLARAIAGEHGLPLGALRGTGPGGRIVRADVLAHIEASRRSSLEAPQAVEKTPSQPSRAPVPEMAERIPIRGARRVIFENMFLSLSRTAQLTLHTDACAEAVASLRRRLEGMGKGISYNAVFVKAVAAALREHPRMNARVEGEEIVLLGGIHVGVAVDARDTLVVPVVRDADRKGLREIQDTLGDLFERAREGRLTPDDLSGGTFTITNLGFAGVDHFTPILRPPETGILGIGRILRRPVVKGEAVVPELRVGLSLTFDHRIIDGAPAGRFLQTITERVEEPGLLSL